MKKNNKYGGKDNYLNLQKNNPKIKPIKISKNSNFFG